jgi:hypothetical protein
MALEAKTSIPPAQWIHLRYEDIFERPVDMFRDAFSQLGVPFTSALEARCADLRPTSVVKGTPKLHKWKDSGNADAIARILPTISPMMQALGYDDAA